MWINWILVSLFLFSGAFCSWSDIKYHIVSNRIIGVTCIISMVLQIINGIINPPELLSIYLINVSLSSIIAVILYVRGMWAAGDVKLFFLLLLTIPIQWLDTTSLSLSVAPYLFIFSFAILWLAIDSTKLMIQHAERFDNKIPLDKKRIINIFSMYINITALQAIIISFFPEFYHNNELFVSTLLIMYSFLFASKSWMKHWSIAFLHGMILIALIVSKKWTWSFSIWWVYLLIAVILLFHKWASGYNYQRISVASVKVGMILSSQTVCSFLSSRIKNLPTDASETMTARLTDEQVKAINRWSQSEKGSPNVIVIRKLPFAIFIFIGFLSWITIRLWGGIL